ncbi:MAG: type II toxin-antitoxin system Phd/YefM family antitoxin [Helicobacteraceae bacterium]|jgi:prevent-host-death family protein|nr:type II toxin-antitoxin system Phd/YefM family antitoxin [Helicobacteraceae bacterium]
METIALAEARENFSKIVDRVADNDEAIIITRYGKEAAALVSLKRFRGEDGFIASLDSWRQKETLPTKSPFEGVRQKDDARVFEW